MQRRQFNSLILSALAGVVLPINSVLAQNSNGVRRSLRFNLVVENPFAHPLKNQKIFLFGPATNSAQRIENIQVDIFYNLHNDMLGNNIIELCFDLPAYASKVITLKIDVFLGATKFIDDNSNLDIFFGDEKFIETNATDIRALGLSLKKETPELSARSIYDWVRSNIKYSGYVLDDQGALHVLKSLRGDCTEYAYLSAALARVCGIPARVIGGYVLDHDTVLRAADYHNWTEVFLGDTWALLDAQKEIFMEINRRYLKFETISTRRNNAMNGAHRFYVDGQIVVKML